MTPDEQHYADDADSLFEHAACGLLISRDDGTIVRVNQTFLDWTGHDRTQVLAGRKFRDLLTVAGRIFYETHYAPLLKMQGAISEIALDLVRPGGESLPVLVSSLQRVGGDSPGGLIRTALFPAAQRRVYERELLLARRKAEQLGSIIHSANEAILIFAVAEPAAGVVQSWNCGAEMLFGFDSAEAVGRSITDLITPASMAHEDVHALAELTANRPIRLTTIRRAKDGRLIDVAMSLTPYADENGVVIAAAGVVQDITSQMQTELRLRNAAEAEKNAREESDRTIRIKDEFLATLSHELRTPLNAILGWAELLQLPGMDEAERSEGLRVIEKNGRVQSQLIDDLLDMTRIISGKMRLDVQMVDLAEVVTAAIDTAMPALTAKQIRLQKVIDPGVRVFGDPGRLQQVFWNLLGNAGKFTSRGGLIKVAVHRVNSHVEVHIVDNGAGMSRDFLAVAFDRFRQADSASTRKTTGLGLGLSIVKSVVEMHGGLVEARSDGEGLGSTFIVNLPTTAVQQPNSAERVHPRAALTQTPPISHASAVLEGVKVLVVDDDADSRQLLKRLLTGSGATVAMAASAGEGLPLVQSFAADVLISDIGMPGEDGYTFIKRVRMLGQKASGNVPAIALTAFARVDDRTLALMAGFSLHLAKPVNAAELIAAVVNLANGSRT